MKVLRLGIIVLSELEDFLAFKISSCVAGYTHFWYAFWSYASIMSLEQKLPVLAFYFFLYSFNMFNKKLIISFVFKLLIDDLAFYFELIFLISFSQINEDWCKNLTVLLWVKAKRIKRLNIISLLLVYVCVALLVVHTS